MMNKPTVLSTGEWLLPASVWERAGQREAPRPRTATTWATNAGPT